MPLILITSTQHLAAHESQAVGIAAALWRSPGLGWGETQCSLFVVVLKEKTKHQRSAVRYISMTDGLHKKIKYLEF